MNQPATLEKNISLFRLAFRPFFLFGSLFSLIALTLWVNSLNGILSFSPYGNIFWWHSHEMLFGFVVAIVVGFLLTAVQNWSGIPSIRGYSLLLLFFLWLLARILLLINIESFKIFTAIIDLLFLPVATFFLAKPILKKKLYRNLIFIPVLLAMTTANVLMHWSVLNGNYLYLNQASYSMIFLVTLLMTVLGGRVFPIFTANGTNTRRVESLFGLEILSIISVLLVVIIFAFKLPLPNKWLGLMLVIISLFHFIRFIRWRFWVTLKTPLVWSLHVSYFCIPLGFLMMGLHFLFGLSTLSNTVHIITVGAMGTMILAMISRVSLGHTGRMIVVGKIMAIAFGCLVLAFITRTLLTLLYTNKLHLLTISSVFWCVGYGIFVIQYFPILTKPRVDGKAG